MPLFKDQLRSWHLLLPFPGKPREGPLGLESGGNLPGEGETGGWRERKSHRREVESAMRGVRRGPLVLSHLISRGSRLGTSPDISLHVQLLHCPHLSTPVSGWGAEARGWVWDKGKGPWEDEGKTGPVIFPSACLEYLTIVFFCPLAITLLPYLGLPSPCFSRSKGPSLQHTTALSPSGSTQSVRHLELTPSKASSPPAWLNILSAHHPPNLPAPNFSGARSPGLLNPLSYRSGNKVPIFLAL